MLGNAANGRMWLAPRVAVHSEQKRAHINEIFLTVEAGHPKGGSASIFSSIFYPIVGVQNAHRNFSAEKDLTHCFYVNTLDIMKNIHEIFGLMIRWNCYRLTCVLYFSTNS